MQLTWTQTLEINEILHQLAKETYELTTRLQKPKLKDVRWRKAMIDSCQNLAQKVRAVSDSTSIDVVIPTLERLHESLNEYARTLVSDANIRRLKELTGTMSDQYEELRRRIRTFRRSHKDELGPAAKPIELRPLKPTNYRRNLFHVGMGLFGVLMYELVLNYQWAVGITGILAGSVVLLELARRIHPKVNWALTLPFKHIIRPWERNRPNSASWYSVAVFLAVLLMPQFAAELGVLILAFADPAATLMGKRFGRKKIYQAKSFVGSATFLITALLTGAILFALAGPEMPPVRAAAMIGTVALTATATELACDRLDDNFAIPLLAAGVATLWLTY